MPTQQSVKAYVDTQLTAEDLDFQADSGGALSIDLDSETQHLPVVQVLIQVEVVMTEKRLKVAGTDLTIIYKQNTNLTKDK